MAPEQNSSYYVEPIYLQHIVDDNDVVFVSATIHVPLFSAGTAVGSIEHHVDRAAGCAASRKHPGYLYVHNDAMSIKPRFYVINAHTGEEEGHINTPDAEQHNWSDIAVGPCHRGNARTCIYILDDSARTVYRLIEPDELHLARHPHLDIDSVLRFEWSEQEVGTIMVDNEANVFIIATTSHGLSKMVQLPNDAWGHNSRVMLHADKYYNTHSNNMGPLGGDISADGREVLIVTNDKIYYYYVGDNDDLLTVLSQDGASIPYHKVPHIGEAVCWSTDGSAYYTLSVGEDPVLYKYQRYY